MESFSARLKDVVRKGDFSGLQQASCLHRQCVDHLIHDKNFNMADLCLLYIQLGDRIKATCEFSQPFWSIEKMTSSMNIKISTSLQRMYSAHVCTIVVHSD